MVKIDNFFVSYLYTIEKNFFINIQNLIISYPIIWHNFIENILKKKIIIVIDDFRIIVYKEMLDKRSERIYYFILERLNQSYVINETIQDNTFDIITFITSKIIIVFSDYDYWLYLITLKACKDLKINIDEKTYYSLENNKYIFFLNIVLNSVNYNICFNDTTHSYIVEKYFLESKERLIIVSTKNIKVENENITLIKYHHNYSQFKEELLEILIFGL